MSQVSRAEQVYQELISAIRNGRLLPGARIVENELAQEMGVSRTPVREAIRRLESEGLIASTPHAGMTVARLDYQAVVELYQMREVLEGVAASLAAKHAAEPEIYNLREILSAEVRSQDSESHARQNQRFHNALYHAAHNRYLLKSLNSLRDAMSLLGVTTYRLPYRSESAFEEHQSILNAIESGDAHHAEQAARAHIRAAQQARIRMMQEAD